MKPQILAIIVLSFLFPGNNVLATPTVDGVFDLDEWEGFYNAGDNIRGTTPNTHPSGGEGYDVEYLGLYFTSDTVYFGIQMGYDPRPDENYYTPGDFALDTDMDGGYEYAIDFSLVNDVVSYTLVDMSGETASWEAPVIYGDATPFQAVYSPVDVVSGVSFDCAFSGQYNSRYSSTYVMEGSFNYDSAVFGQSLGDTMAIHWTMECGNDYLTQKSHATTPEPATVFLFGSGLLSLGAMGRKFRASHKA